MLHRIFFCTIPHTGSRFLIHHVFKKYKLRAPAESYNTEFVSHWLHNFDENKDGIKLLSSECPMIVPLRNPRDVYLSWYVRLHRTGIDHSVKHLHKLWNNMIEFVDTLNPFYIVIDGPSRDQQLQAVLNHVGVELKTDWEYFGKPRRYTSEDLKDVKYNCPEKIMNFYNEKANAAN